MPTHNHNIIYGKNAFGAGNYDNNSIIWTQSRTKTTTENTGGNNSHNNLQPYIVQNFIIKAYNNARTLSIVENSLDSDSTKNAASVHSVNEKITNLTTYSTEEVKTGKFWDDGKPIYRKTLIYINKEIANGTIIAHNIQNINEVTDFEGRFNDNGTLYTFPFVYEGTNSKLYIRCNKTSIVFQSDGALTLSAKSTRKSRFTIEYTKTTD